MLLTLLKSLKTGARSLRDFAVGRGAAEGFCMGVQRRVFSRVMAAAWGSLEPEARTTAFAQLATECLDFVLLGEHMFYEKRGVGTRGAARPDQSQ